MEDKIISNLQQTEKPTKVYFVCVENETYDETQSFFTTDRAFINYEDAVKEFEDQIKIWEKDNSWVCKAIKEQSDSLRIKRSGGGIIFQDTFSGYSLNIYINELQIKY